MPDLYEYPYNFSNGTEVNGTGQFVQYANYISGDMLGIGILLLIFLAVLAMSLISGAKKAFMTAGFISFIFSIYLNRLGMINPIFIIICIVITIIGALGTKSEGKTY